MINFFIKRFIKNYDDINSPAVRNKYGVLCGIVGIILNTFMFGIKFLAGILSNSASITADAFNNLSDSGSSLVSILGFKLASQKPDKDHPFGHGRFEYISGLAVSFIIILMGIELARDSVYKIFNPNQVRLTAVSAIILCLSILIKLYMAYYNNKIGKKINSAAMKAASADSISDVVSTTTVLLCMLLSYFTEIKIDGFCGLAVSLFIIKTGVSTAGETINPLLGQPPKKEFVDEIHNIVMSYPQVIGMHDLVVHDYGPGRTMVSLHAEVPENSDLLETHDCIDNIEKLLCEKLNCNVVIHMDPVVENDEFSNNLKETITGYLKETVDLTVSLHDFRIVRGNTHTNIIFDVVIPCDYKCTDEEMRMYIQDYISSINSTFYSVVTVDRNYTE